MSDLDAIRERDADEWPLMESILASRREIAPSIPEPANELAYEDRHRLLAALDEAAQQERERLRAGLRERLILHLGQVHADEGFTLHRHWHMGDFADALLAAGLDAYLADPEEADHE